MTGVLLLYAGMGGFFGVGVTKNDSQSQLDLRMILILI